MIPLREQRKRGRPLGATSWWRNPNRVAAHQAQVLMELWLAGAPVLEIRVMLSSLAGKPEQRELIEECWSRRPNERRYTVPPKIKRKLCELAVAHVAELRRETILRLSCQAAQNALRNQGWTDMQIAEIRSRDRGPIHFNRADPEEVLNISNWCAPTISLRRKATDRKLRR